MLRLMISSVLSGIVFLSAVTQMGFTAEEHHHDKGPHQGQLVELGEEEFHAELVHDAKEGTVTIYLLAADAKTDVGTDAKDVVINAKVKGKGVQFKLPAARQKLDKPGLSSRFALKSKELSTLVDDPHANAAVRVTINGKSFNGKLEHDHDHDHVEPSAAKKK